MHVWPAIDLRGGKCVRLVQGDYQRETVFGDDVAAMARQWVSQGATRLHLVDLDGARDGRLINGEAVKAIVDAVDVPCQLGGGVRNEDTIRSLLELNLAQLVVGTQALREPDWFRQMSAKYPGQLALGLDARNGMVATDGWLETSTTSALDLAAAYDSQPLAAIVYTDIDTDGMLQGPNVMAMSELQAAAKSPVIASGGVTTADDVRRLAEIGVSGCIIGRALYEGTLALPDALAAATNGKQQS